MVEEGGTREPGVPPSADQPAEAQPPGTADPGSDEAGSSAEIEPRVDAQQEPAPEAAARPEAASEAAALPAPESVLPPPFAAYAPPPAQPPPPFTAQAAPAPPYAPQPPPPQGGWQPPPGGWPAVPYPTADTAGWYWCPNHLIASEKEGNCPTCGQPFQPAPPWGIPAGPYRPKVSITQRSRREKIAYFAAGLVLAALALGTVVGLTALYRHGTPLDSNGQPVTSEAVASAPGGSVSSSTDTNSSRLQLRSLEGKNLVLAGHWTRTTQVYNAMITEARSLTTDNSQPPLDVAASKGAATVAVFNIPSTDPAKTISDNSPATSVSSSDTGGAVVFSASQSVTIDGKASNYKDITVADNTGKTVFVLRIFYIPTSSHVVMVAVGTTGPRDDIDTVSQALQTLQ